MKKARISSVVVASCAGWIGIVNLAPLWNGVVFVVLVAPLLWATSVALDWARR